MLALPFEACRCKLRKDSTSWGLTTALRLGGFASCTTYCRRARSHEEPCRLKTATMPLCAFTFHTCAMLHVKHKGLPQHSNPATVLLAPLLPTKAMTSERPHCEMRLLAHDALCKCSLRGPSFWLPGVLHDFQMYAAERKLDMSL